MKTELRRRLKKGTRASSNELLNHGRLWSGIRQLKYNQKYCLIIPECTHKE